MAGILIVDDEEEVCDYLKRLIEKMGLEVEVECVLTGDEALERIRLKEWKIAVVDLKLSTAVTGLEVIKAIRDRWPKSAVMAMTGYVDVGLRQKAEHLGVSHYLEKPEGIRPDFFSARIKELLANFGDPGETLEKNHDGR